MSVPNGDTPDFPDYLNKTFFRKAVENGLNKSNVEIIDLNFTMGSKAGDNYTSSIYRVKVTFKEPKSTVENISLIVKSMPIDSNRKFLEELDVHVKETSIYEEILPKMQKSLSETKLAPKYFYSISDPIRTIVFEDLKDTGFILADRHTGVDELHCSLTLKKMAKFHALSMDLLKKDPKLEEQFKEGFFNEGESTKQMFDIVFGDNIKRAAEMVSDMKGYEHFADKLIIFQKHALDMFFESVKSDPSGVKVINHGDFSVNNIMFKYNDETKKPIDVLLLDFQGSFCAGPGIDLNYFFITSVRLDALKKKNELIEKCYYPVFRETLKNIGYKRIPSLDDILTDVRSREIFSAMNLFGVLPIFSMDDEESKTNDMSLFFDKEIASKKQLVGMSGKRFIDTMQYTLKYFEKLNTIDDAISKLKLNS